MAGVEEWNAEAMMMFAKNRTKRNMLRAVQFIVGAVKVAINRGNATGDNPSEPYTPPKKVTSRLFQSITGEVDQFGEDIIGRVGSNVEYARALELGFRGTDSAGRNRVLLPRPYLRTTLKKRSRTILKILGGA